MKTQENKKVKWSVSIALILILIVGALVGAFLNKDKETDLIITAENIVVEEGQTEQLDYEVSIKNAEIRASIRDEKIARIENDNVFGKVAGSTELVIVAIYKSMVYEKKVEVIVTEKKDINDENSKEDGKEENPKDENVEEKPNPENPKEELKFEIFKIMGCVVEGNTIEVQVGKTAKIQFLTEEFGNIQLSSNDYGIVVTKAEEGQNVIVINANHIGEYEIKVKIGDKEAEIIVIVKGV